MSAGLVTGRSTPRRLRRVAIVGLLVVMVSGASMLGDPAVAKKRTASKSGGLGSGSRGPAVAELQTLLQAAHYDISVADGGYGEQTFHAVMAFQKANGLARTGRATTQLIAALKSGMKPAPLFPDGGADRVEVSIPKQYLALYRGGELVRILSVSTGSGKDFCTIDPETDETACDKAVTPGGSFRVTRRVIGWRESKLGLMYNPLYFAGGVAIHGAPSVPASPASHGCVRIPMVSADALPTILPDGIPVYVFDGETPVNRLSSRIAASDAWVVGSLNPPTTVPSSSTRPTSTPTSPTASTTSTTSGSPTSSTKPGTTTTVAGNQSNTTKASQPTTTTPTPTSAGGTTTTKAPTPSTTSTPSTLVRSLTTSTTAPPTSPPTSTASTVTS